MRRSFPGIFGKILPARYPERYSIRPSGSTTASILRTSYDTIDTHYILFYSIYYYWRNSWIRRSRNYSKNNPKRSRSRKTCLTNPSRRMSLLNRRRLRSWRVRRGGGARRQRTRWRWARMRSRRASRTFLMRTT